MITNKELRMIRDYEPKPIELIIGSQEDLKYLTAADVENILTTIGVGFNVSVISAHRNPDFLKEFCKRCVQGLTKVIIALAGRSAALPGAIEASFSPLNLNPVVIGVALPSAEYPNASDALFAMTRLPSGTPVATTGDGVAGIQNAVYLACKIVALAGGTLVDQVSLEQYSLNLIKKKSPKIGVEIPKKVM